MESIFIGVFANLKLSCQDKKRLHFYILLLLLVQSVQKIIVIFLSFQFLLILVRLECL